jgi:hypothetical protein
MLVNEIEHTGGTSQLFSLVIQVIGIGSEKAVKNHPWLIQGRNGLSRSPKRKRTGSSWFPNASISRHHERAISRRFTKSIRCDLICRDSIFQLTGFEFRSSQKDVSGIVASHLPASGMRETFDNRDLFAQCFERFQTFIELKIATTVSIRKPSPI